MTANLEHEEFSKHLNTTFRISVDESSTIEAELSEVGELVLSPGQQYFAIVFRGPREPQLNQGIRQLNHDEMGELTLFLVPLRQDDQSTFYEAVFNRVLKGD